MAHSISLTTIGWGLPHRSLAHCLDSDAMVQAKPIADLQEANQERQLTLSKWSIHREAERATGRATNVVVAQGSKRKQDDLQLGNPSGKQSH